MVSDVLYFYSEQKITKARLADGTDEIIPHTMDELEQQLDPKLFFRANRQFIICINAVELVYNYFNNKLKVTMRKNTDVEIIVSRDKAPLLKIGWVINDIILYNKTVAYMATVSLYKYLYLEYQLCNRFII